MTVAHLAESRDDSSGRSQMNQIMERNERSVSKKRPTTPSFSETAPKSTRKRKKSMKDIVAQEKSSEDGINDAACANKEKEENDK